MQRMLLLSGLIFMIVQVQAQFVYDYTYDFDLLGKGARAAGMAYAFNAVADDATALSWNPAGIVQIKKPELAFSNSIKNTEYRHAVLEYDYKAVYSFDFLGFVYFENLPSENSKMHGKRNLTVNSASLSAAFSVTRFIGIGVSYNQWFSLGNNMENYEYLYKKYADEYTYERNVNYKFSGHNFTAGILLDFSVFHVPLRYTLKYDSKLWLTDAYKFTGREELIHYDGADTTYLNLLNVTEKFEYPGIITNGFAYRIGNYLTLACDFDIQLFQDNSWIYDYSQTRSYITGDQETIYVDDKGYEDDVFFYDFIAFNQYRIGLEYILHPEFGYIPVRAGYKNSPTEMNTFDKYKKPVKRTMANSINCGTGITLKCFSIDLAYEANWFHRMDEEFRDEKKIDHFFILSAIWYIK
jgi:hypothetical protein